MVRSIFKLIEHTSLITYILLLCIYFHLYPGIKFSYTIIPFVVYSLTRLVYYFLYNNQQEYLTLNDFFITTYRLFIVLQFGMISLKLDKNIKWDWQEIFWVSWVGFSVLMGLCFGVTFMLLTKIFFYIFYQVENFELKGILWLFLVIIGYTVNLY